MIQSALKLKQFLKLSRHSCVVSLKSFDSPCRIVVVYGCIHVPYKDFASLQLDLFMKEISFYFWKILYEMISFVVCRKKKNLISLSPFLHSNNPGAYVTGKIF